MMTLCAVSGAVEVKMDKLMIPVGRLVGSIGMLVVLLAVAARALGHFWIGGLQTGTILLGGIGAIGIGSFLLLFALTLQEPRR
jgi:hypothetical protein